MIRAIKNYVMKRVSAIAKVEAKRAVDEMLPIMRQIVAFEKSAPEERQSHYDHTKNPAGSLALYASVKERLIERGLPVEEEYIDIFDFENWMNRFPEFREHYRKMGEIQIEKCLEHYLSFRYLRISENDTLIDIAADESPFAEILNGRGIRSFRLDQSYPEGVHGIRIGADAADTGLSDALASVLSVHCAYECFMGDADIRFLGEANRILSPKGRYGIVPLYLEDTYFIATSPYCDQNKIEIDSGARRVWRDDAFQAPFARFYSPEAFAERVYSRLPGNTEGKILYFANVGDLIRRYPGQVIYCFFMFCCEKH